MKKDSIDPGFESYRRERQRRGLNGGKANAPQQDHRTALRELEAVEAKEERSRALARDVHDFFESATRMAANIVSRVAQSARLEVDSKLHGEVEEFLADALHRLEEVVLGFVARNHGPEATEEVEPKMRNMVGEVLDNFRKMGTAAPTKHLGEDPMQKDLADVRREFQQRVPSAKGEASIVPVTALAAAVKDVKEKGSAPDIDQHLVAETAPPETAPAPAAKDGKKGKQKQQGLTPELEQFKEQLKHDVRTGAKTRDEARAAWQDRVSGKK
jgi:hypothetical protein